MNTKTLLTILILIIITLSISACEEDTDDRPPIGQSCGDGVCDERESKKGICPEDCREIDPIADDDDDDTRINEFKIKALERFDGELIENLEYANIDETSLLLDLYLPDTEETLPVVVWVHGGAWNTGSKDDVANYNVLIASNDYVVASIDHRYSSQAIFPAQIHDVKAAIRYLRANPNNYNYNPENIGAIGSSSGGHLVSLLGTSSGYLEGEVGDYLEYSSTVQAVVDLFGPVNIQTLTEDCENICVMDHDTSTSPESGLLGCRPSECPDEASEASATTYISADDPPFLIIHGDEDSTISYLQSQDFNQLLQDNGLESEFILAEGYGHDRSMAAFYLDEIIDFFDSHLKD